jgi:hypothetical protein
MKKHLLSLGCLYALATMGCGGMETESTDGIASTEDAAPDQGPVQVSTEKLSAPDELGTSESALTGTWYTTTLRLGWWNCPSDQTMIDYASKQCSGMGYWGMTVGKIYGCYDPYQYQGGSFYRTRRIDFYCFR